MALKPFLLTVVASVVVTRRPARDSRTRVTSHRGGGAGLVSVAIECVGRPFSSFTVYRTMCQVFAVILAVKDLSSCRPIARSCFLTVGGFCTACSFFWPSTSTTTA
ncbi:hypothetical protein EDC96DRAFT_520594 [Choanephora cucurbitarum]|nr:hypothetical protein EDC96DRAFT_520903 [Choanephora cucurbitarum]KAI8348437.1 hypothetical protein EDC96DRAFT_520594 [Choanephora cucurbitarum]